MTKKEIKKLLNNSNIVRIYDYNDFDPDKCVDGGKYAFWTKYTKENKDVWRISYHTSSDFEYCDKVGIFMSCNNCIDFDKETGECTRGYAKIYTQHLIKEIEDTLKAIKKDRKYEIRFYDKNDKLIETIF